MLDGIKCYLGSRMIRSIGPIYAKKMIGAFGIHAPKSTGADPLIEGRYTAA